MSRCAAIERELVALYGDGIDWRRADGVLHVAAIAADPRAALAVGPGTIGCSTDRFILGFARARADAIVTTSAILRAEPELVHRTADDPVEAEGWRAFRRDVLGRSTEPELVVLAHRGELPRDHPALHAASRVVVVTSAPGRARLAEAGCAFEVVVLPDSAGRASATARTVREEPVDPACRALSRAMAWLREERGAGTIVLEAGPRSTFGLYAADAPVRVDELLLSIFEGDGATFVPGPSLPPRAALIRSFGAGLGAEDAAPTSPLRSARRRNESSGPWCFERYRRPAARS